MKGYYLDSHPDANVANEHFAIVKILDPNKKRKRNRCPETNVTVMDNIEMAREHADPALNIFAAKVIGPARSSEGINLYYITELYS